MLPSIPIPSVWWIAKKRAQPTACALRPIAWLWFCVGGGSVFLAGVLAWNSLFILAGIVFAAARFCRAGDSALELARRSARALARRFCRLGRHLESDSADSVRSDLQARRVCHRADGQTVLGRLRQVDLAGARRPDVSDRSFSDDLRHRPQRRRRADGRGIYFALWNLSRRLVSGALQAVSNLGYSLVEWLDLGRFGLYGASMFESLSGGLGTAAFLAFLDERLPERTRHGAIRVFIFGIFAHRTIDWRRSAGLGAEKYGFANYFAITFLAVDAGVFTFAVGEAVDSRRGNARALSR